MSEPNDRFRSTVMSRCWPAALLVLFVMVFHQRLLRSSPGEMIHTADIGFYFQWLHTYVRDEFLSGRIPLWNPYTYCGTPFAANPQATVFYPPSWLHLLMPVVHAHKFMIALHGLMGGAFMYLYLRSVSIARPAAIIGCLPYMFGNYVMGNVSVGHLTVVFTAAWLPLILYCVERAHQCGSWRFWIAAGVAFGAQVLAGEPQSSYYSALAVGMYSVVRTVIDMRQVDRSRRAVVPARSLAGLVLFAAVAAGASAIQWLPTAEFAAHSDRSERSLEFATSGSFPPVNVIEFILPWSNVRGAGLSVENVGYGLMIYQEWEFAGYVGMLTLVLAGVSLCARRSAGQIAARCMLTAAAIMMLGSYTPVYRVLYEILPGLSQFRIPARAMFIAHWCLATMAAGGADWLWRAEPETRATGLWRSVAIAGVLGIIITLIGAVQMVGLHWLARQAEGALISAASVRLDDWRIARALLCLGATLVILIVIGRISRQRAMWSIGIMLGADLCMNTPEVPLRTFVAEREPGYELLRALRDNPDAPVRPYRIDLPPRQAIANMALALRVEMINGYSPLAIDRFFRFVHAMRGGELSGVSRVELPARIYEIEQPFPLRMLNVWFTARWDRLPQEFRPSADVRAMPRGWIVRNTRTASDADAALKQVTSIGFDPAREAVVEGWDSGPDFKPQSDQSEVSGMRRLHPGHLQLHTQCSDPGLLVLSEVFYPGWVLRIDGQRQKTLRTNYVLTGVRVPSGAHTIDYQYEPWSFRIGAACTALTSMVILISMAIQRRRGFPRKGSPSPGA